MPQEPQNEWARETPRKRFSTPYTLAEKLSWLKNIVFGPSTRYRELTHFIQQPTVLNPISPRYRLGFIGDILKTKHRDLTIAEDVKRFFADVDYLIANFEGTISRAKRVFMAQEHDERILDTLKTLLPPEKVVLTQANNHAGDFGWTEFSKSYKMLQDNGFVTIGRRDNPAVLLAGKMNVANVTMWSNQPCRYIAYSCDLDRAFDPDAQINILSPHWGYEFQLYPSPKQIEHAVQLLRRWNLIVGHHSHCPQPVTAYDIDGRKRLLAYSLGDFCVWSNMNKARYGIALKVEVGPDSQGRWNVGSVQWRFTFTHHTDNKSSTADWRTHVGSSRRDVHNLRASKRTTPASQSLASFTTACYTSHRATASRRPSSGSRVGMNSCPM